MAKSKIIGLTLALGFVFLFFLTTTGFPRFFAQLDASTL